MYWLVVAHSIIHILLAHIFNCFACSANTCEPILCLYFHDNQHNNTLFFLGTFLKKVKEMMEAEERSLEYHVNAVICLTANSIHVTRGVIMLSAITRTCSPCTTYLHAVKRSNIISLVWEHNWLFSLAVIQNGFFFFHWMLLSVFNVGKTANQVISLFLPQMFNVSALQVYWTICRRHDVDIVSAGDVGRP